MSLTNDAVIREALIAQLSEKYSSSQYRIIPELGVQHGAARIDVAIVNGILHGFEIKSDKDTLLRLRDQRDYYNHVFDQVTLVVGKTHLFDAIKIVPDWWGLQLAKKIEDGSVIFQTIREARDNQFQDGVSVARLLWRQEALDLLENMGQAKGVRSKPREEVYVRLANSLELEPLKQRVRHVLQYCRQDWRSDAQPV
ncbi:MAG TPA: sce7726 family protein [Candidatus Paceibacterota bacterium]|nr:sce7726 family protein [Candidatus Paceibacterota bacterium]